MRANCKHKNIFKIEQPACLHKIMLMCGKNQIIPKNTTIAILPLLSNFSVKHLFKGALIASFLELCKLH